MNYAIEFTLTNIMIIITIIFLANLFVLIKKAKIDYLVYTNVFLLFLALVEPSPSDFIFISLLIVSIKEKRLFKDKSSKMRIAIWSMLSYMVVASLSMLNMTDYYAGLRFYGITIYLMIYCLLIFFYTDNKNYINIIRFFIISSTLAACSGIIGYLGYFPDYLLFDEYRTKALFKDPNVFGAFLVPTILFLLADIRSRNLIPLEHKRLEKLKTFKYVNIQTLLYTILILVNMIGVIISYSRGAWVSLGAGTLILILLNVKRIKFKNLTLYLSIIISMGWVLWAKVLSVETQEFFLERLSIKEYDTTRFTVQLIGFSKAMDYVFGYGPGQYENVLVQVIGEEYSAHSVYARIMLENGILGFVFLMLVFGYILFKLFKRCKSEELHNQSSAYISILIALLINSLVIDTLHWRHLWLFLGLSMSFISNFQKAPSPVRNRKEGFRKVLQAEIYFLIRNILAFIGMLLYSFKQQEQEIIILMYHRVNDHINQAIAVKEARFQWQMKYLMKRGYKVISMEEAYQKIKDKSMDGKYIVLTFDDGYEDFYETAYPVLKNHSYSAILYLVPGFIQTDKVFPWDQELGLSQLMNWEQIKSLKEDTLIMIGSHTLNHFDIESLDNTTLRQELEESKKILEEKLDTKVIHFAYPKGVYCEEAEKILPEFYETGVLIYKGVTINNQVKPEEYFRLKRIPVYRRDGKFMFIARLKGWIRIEEIVRKKIKAF